MSILLSLVPMLCRDRRRKAMAGWPKPGKSLVTDSASSQTCSPLWNRTAWFSILPQPGLGDTIADCGTFQDGDRALSCVRLESVQAGVPTFFKNTNDTFQPLSPRPSVFSSSLARSHQVETRQVRNPLQADPPVGKNLEGVAPDDWASCRLRRAVAELVSGM